MHAGSELGGGLGRRQVPYRFKMPNKTELVINPIMNKMMKAGIDAIAHLTMKETIDPNGISKSMIFTCPMTG